MKVALGQKIQEVPWGGGNRFAAALASALEGRGDKVVCGLDDPDIDLIVLTDPRARNPFVVFTPGAVMRYLLFRNPRALVVHRINECDERKGNAEHECTPAAGQLLRRLHGDHRFVAA